ncbi:hypothetical protein [Serratia fonticola]
MTMEWLVGFDIKVAGVETNKHVLIQASSLDIAERGIRAMGGSWWPQLLQEECGHWWYFPQGEVWFSGITLLDEQASAIFHQLNFLDCWQVTEMAICDEYGNDWRDIER